MGFFDFVHSLGSKVGQGLHYLGEKAPSFYDMAKKGFGTALDVGRAVVGAIESPTGQAIMDVAQMIPGAAPIVGAIRSGTRMAKGLLERGEALQQKVNTGEQMYRQVKGAYELANQQRGEMPRQLQTPPMAPVPNDPRIPQPVM